MSLQPLIPLTLAFLAGLLSNWDKFTETDPLKRRRSRGLALLSMVVLTGALAWQYYEYYKKDDSDSRFKRHIAHTFPDVSEASGGAAIGDVGYLVDDDSPTLFTCKFQENRFAAPETLKLFDQDGKTLTKNDVDDLEAVAEHDGKLYLVTSHSNTKGKVNKSARQRFLEVRVDGDADHKTAHVLRWAALRIAIEGCFFKNNLFPFADRLEVKTGSAVETVVEIEGLAVLPDATVYFGLRGPQDPRSRAVILKTSLNSVFSEGTDWSARQGEKAPASSCDFKVIAVDVGGDLEDPRGIVDMAYHDGSLLLLTNGAFHHKALEPELFTLSLQRELDGQQPVCIGRAFYRPPDNVLARPEALLFPPTAPQKLVVFLDAENFGGGQYVCDMKDLEAD